MAGRNVDEYLVCVPKHDLKKYNVMRFNAGDNVDIRVSYFLNVHLLIIIFVKTIVPK